MTTTPIPIKQTDDEIRAQVRRLAATIPPERWDTASVIGGVKGWAEIALGGYAYWSDHQCMVAIREWLAVWDERQAVEIERLRRELAIASINPEDHHNTESWSPDCNGWSTPVPTHDLCDDTECGCPCHGMAAGSP